MKFHINRYKLVGITVWLLILLVAVVTSTGNPAGGPIPPRTG